MSCWWSKERDREIETTLPLQLVGTGLQVLVPTPRQLWGKN